MRGLSEKVGRKHRTDNPPDMDPITEGGQFRPPRPLFRSPTEPSPCPMCGTFSDPTGNGTADLYVKRGDR